jgi:hypothetical protein
MGRIYAWDEFGWHKFSDAENRSNNWNVGWCDVCDCIEEDHEPLENYKPTYARQMRLAGTPLPEHYANPSLRIVREDTEINGDGEWTRSPWKLGTGPSIKKDKI